jgi:microsomal epoxide hydrolase
LVKLVTLVTSKDENQEDKIHFDIICPSLPGFGFSEPPVNQSFDVKHVASIIAKLMKLLNYKKYFCHGGDFGKTNHLLNIL